MLSALEAGPLPGYEAALGYLQGKYDAFQHLGRVELPALRTQAQDIWHAANAASDQALASAAQDEFTHITDLQRDWELHNETVEGIAATLRKIGITLGAVPALVLPAVRVMAAVIAVVLAMRLLFSGRDQVKEALTELMGRLPPDQAAAILEKYLEKTNRTSWPAAIVTVALVAGAMFLAPKLLKASGR